jgi:hypothetical protein
MRRSESRGEPVRPRGRERPSPFDSPDSADNELSGVEPKHRSRLGCQLGFGDTVQHDLRASTCASRVERHGLGDPYDQIGKTKRMRRDAFPPAGTARDHEMESRDRRPTGETSGNERREAVALVGQVHVSEGRVGIAKHAGRSEDRPRRRAPPQARNRTHLGPRVREAPAGLLGRSVAENGDEMPSVAEL